MPSLQPVYRKSIAAPSAWYGIVAPKGTPAEIVDALNKAINAMLADPAAKARFIDLGEIPKLTNG